MDQVPPSHDDTPAPVDLTKVPTGVPAGEPTEDDWDTLAEAAGPAPLATFTRGRAWLGALVLLGAYLIPVGIAWLAARFLIDADGWMAPTGTFIVTLGLWLWLTIKFGGAFQLVEFGENYMLTYGVARRSAGGAVAGFALFWWRWIVQVGAFILIGLAIGQAMAEGDLPDIDRGPSGVQLFSAHMERLPVPADWTKVHDSIYIGVDELEFRGEYVAGARFNLKQAKAWMSGPDWTRPQPSTSAADPFGALVVDSCDTVARSCTAHVAAEPGAEPGYVLTISWEEAEPASAGTAVNVDVVHPGEVWWPDDASAPSR